MSNRGLFALALPFFLLAGCGEDEAPKDTGKSDSDDVIEQPTCTGTLRILQKDAYKDVAGRSSELWPPHTTTVFDVKCGDEVVETAVQANHGTQPDAVDGNGDVFLEETGILEVEGTEGDLLDLAEAFESCSCDGATTFLTLDTLDEGTASQLLDRVADYVEANLTCPETSGDDLGTLLASGDVDAFLAILPGCTWSDGTSLEAGLDEAIAAATGDLLEDYHVCNNDAALQVELVEQFDASGEIVKCASDAPICHGPTWFYDPLPTDR